MAHQRNIIKSNAEYTRKTENIHGLSNTQKREGTLSFTQNMYVDREYGDGALESIPGYRSLYNFSGEMINGIHIQRLSSGSEYLYVHAGEHLYRFNKNTYGSLRNLTSITEMYDYPSTSFCFGEKIYILDSLCITEIDPEGAVRKISDGSYGLSYIPTTYLNGKPCERRNLLSNHFKESFYVSSADDISYGSPELVYTVIDPQNRYCAVTGIGKLTDTSVYIPRYKVIGGVKYLVTEISSGAFAYNFEIRSIVTNAGLERICSKAFFGLTNLTSVSISDTVKYIDDFCFYGCSSLNDLLLGSGLQSIAASAFSNCDNLKEIRYAASREAFIAIDGSSSISEKHIYFDIVRNSFYVSIPVLSSAEDIVWAYVDDKEWDFYYQESTSEVLIEFKKKSEINGRTVELLGVHKREGGFMSTNLGMRIENPYEAIISCPLCAMYDGRIFFSGNPILGGAVFYSETTRDGDIHPLYFSDESYFIDGSSYTNIVTMTETNGALAVFKSCDDGTGSIFLHTPKIENGERTYPTALTNNKLAVSGPSFRFFDDVVFLSGSSVMRLNTSGGSCHGVECISEPIKHLLMLDDLSDAKFTRWGNYLVLSSMSSIYLADATDAAKNGGEFDWYYISKVGSYLFDSPVYRYSDKGEGTCLVSEHVGEIADGTVMSYINEKKVKIYYVEEDGCRYRVYPTRERTGGGFYPITALFSDNNLLFFGTSSGEFCIFNNDMRRIVPEYLLKTPGIDFDLFIADLGFSIHPYYYSFMGHTPTYCVRTISDDCDISYLEKTTVPHSTHMKLKGLGGSVRCLIKTDETSSKELGIINMALPDFDQLDFEQFCFETDNSQNIVVNDKSRRYVEKEIVLVSDKPESPFGVYSLSYRYKVKGNIKQ